VKNFAKPIKSKFSSLAIISLIPLLSFSQLNWQLIEVPDSIEIRSIASNNQNHIFLGTGGNGIKRGIYRSVDNCNNWIFLGFENSSIACIEMDILNHIYIPASTGIFLSDDNGDNWDTLLFYNSSAGFSCFQSYSNLLFAGGVVGNSTVLIRSIDQGETWQDVLTLPSNVEYFFDIEVINEDTIIACTTHWFDGGGVYKSTDGGDNWEFSGMYDFHCFSLDKNSLGDVFVGTYGHNTQYWLSGVYVLYNGTSEWIQLYSTLVNDMVVNKNDHLFVATDFGVLRSMDNGQTFEYINEGLFTGHVDVVAIDSSGYLYAASYYLGNMARSLESTITGVNDHFSINASISFYNFPNPVSGITNFVVPKPKHGNEAIDITIFNSHGQCIDKISSDISLFERTTIRYNAGSLPAGVYFYHTLINNQRFSNKFIVL
jgi:hypothetical protein